MAISQIKPEGVAVKLCERDTNNAIGCHTEICVEGQISDATNKLTPINKSCRTHQKRTPTTGNTSLPHSLPDGLRVVGLFTCTPQQTSGAVPCVDVYQSTQLPFFPRSLYVTL